MVGYFGIVIQAGLLWLLITYYTRQTNPDQSWRDARIVLIGYFFVAILSRLLLLSIIGPLVLVIEAVALYFIIDKVCGTSQRVTIKICVWYFVVTLAINAGFLFLDYMMEE